MRRSGLDAKSKSVLVNLATRTGENGECWPSISQIAADTYLSSRTVRRALATLESLGLLVKASGKSTGHKNRYVIIVDKLSTPGHPDLPPRSPCPTHVGHADLPPRPPCPTPLATVSYHKKEKKTKGKLVCDAPTHSPTDNSVDKKSAVRLCWGFGATADEANRFWRFNQSRRWTILETMTLEDAARLWCDNFRKQNPDEFLEERRRRLEAKRREKCGI